MVQKVIVFIKGFIIAGCMLIPGVSGGTMALLLNVYDELIAAINGLIKLDFKKLPFLIAMGLGAVLGIVALANPLNFLIDNYPYPTLYFFVGAIFGGIPLMVKKAKEGSKLNWKSLLYVIIGIAVVILLGLLPENLLQMNASAGIIFYVVLAVVGFFIAIALILPGISGSMMLLMLGLYQPAIQAVKSLDIKFLLPLGIGVIIGTLTTTQVLERAMKKYPHGTYMIILGFLLGSIAEVFPGIPTGGFQIVLCIALAIIAFTTLFLFSKAEKN